MKPGLVSLTIALLGASSTVHARGQRHRDIAHKRQVTTTTSTSTSSSSSSLPTFQTTPTTATLTATNIMSTGVPTVTSISVNNAFTSLSASGVPALASITFGMPIQSTLPVTSTYSAGASPPISGAPALPTPFVFATADWPTQDQVPPTDSDQVTEWLKELDGFYIPNLDPTTDGSCVNDTSAAANAASRGWWTCGGYTRPTDIVACPDKMTWGVSFDDGPSPYTQTLLNYLGQKNITATFFVVGSRVIERPNVLIEEYMAGHEISVHTWSHRHLTSLTNEQIVAELGWTRHAIKQVLGVTPTTMRPPFGDIDDRVRAISLAMGLVPIMWTSAPGGTPFDTNDWRVAGGLVTGVQSFTTFENILTNASSLNTGFIVLEHDLYQITVDLAIGYTLNAALTHNPPFTLTSIGKCSHIPATNLYLESNKNTSFPYTNHTYDIDGDGSTDTSNVDNNVGFTTTVPTTLGIMLLGSIAAILI